MPAGGVGLRVQRHLRFGLASLALGSCFAAPPEPEIDTPTAPPVVVEAPPQPADVIEPADPPVPNAFIPATAGTDNCKVTVSALLEAEEYRGPGPLTPAVAASLDADPDYARNYNSESHGDHHIQCVYQVELAHQPGKHYRWRTFFSNTLRDETPEKCKGMAAEVADDIIRTTTNCSDFAAGAYWGFVLEPMP